MLSDSDGLCHGQKLLCLFSKLTQDESQKVTSLVVLSKKKKMFQFLCYDLKSEKENHLQKAWTFFFYRCFLKCLSTWFHSFTFIDVFLWINIKTQQLHLWVFLCYFSNTYNIWIYGLMNHFIRVLSGVIFLIKQYLEICMQI